MVDGINPRNVNGADKKDKVEEEKVVKKVEKEAVVENSGKVYIDMEKSISRKIFYKNL